MEVLIEGVVVGILVVVVGYLLGYLVSFDSTLSNMYESSLMVKFFLSGFITHLSFEYLGFNKWYCKNGFACKS